MYEAQVRWARGVLSESICGMDAAAEPTRMYPRRLSGKWRERS